MARSTLEDGTARDGRYTITALMTDIVRDLRQLVAQELKLAKDEMLEELDKAKRSAIALSIGIGLITIGGLFLLLMLVHLVQWLTQWPLWTCYALVGGIFMVTGWLAMKKGQRTVHDIDVRPTRTIQTTKETMTWLGEQMKSPKM